MCPYCGEEVPADSGRCWKCGTELTEGAKAEGDELEVPDEDEDEGGAPSPGNQLIDCPHCGAQVAKKMRRCKECGRALQEVKTNKGAVAWRYGVWILVVGVGIAVAGTVVGVSLGRKHAAERSKILNITFGDAVSKLQPGKKMNEERRTEVWTKEFQNKFVKWKDGTVTSVDPDRRHVTFSHSTKGKADVVVTFDSDVDLSEGDKKEYSARLVEFGKDKDSVPFTLDEGQLEK
jgi:hypothetical protein